MTKMSCLFCNLPEPNYKPDTGVDYICGGCVILLADASQDELKRAYGKAIAMGYLNKASAIESFLIPEVEDGMRPSKSVRRNIDRKRAARTIRG
jgi:hypothetical protein